MEPPQKKGVRTYGKLELKPRKFEIPGIGGGLHCKIYILEF